MIETEGPAAFTNLGFPVWPHGTTDVRKDGRYGVRLPAGFVIWAGERVSGGGSTQSGDDLPEQIDPACRTNGGAVFSHNVSGSPREETAERGRSPEADGIPTTPPVPR